MSTEARQAVASGIILTGLFFSPLASVPADQRVFLFWQPRDSGELVAACVILGTVFGVATWLALRSSRHRFQASLLCCIWAIPGLNFFSSLARYFSAQRWLRTPAGAVLIPVGLAAALTVLVAAVVRRPHLFRRLVLGLLWICAPVVVLFGVELAKLPVQATVITKQGTLGASRTSENGPSLLVLVFDELSYKMLYDHGAVRGSFPSFSAASSHGTNYHKAKSPGGATFQSLPGYIAGTEGLEAKPGDDALLPLSLDVANSPFLLARAAGYRSEISGYSLPYCDLLKGWVDACHTISGYNASSLGGEWSFWHPIRTNLVLLPHQFPSGLIKNPIHSYHQGAMTAAIVADAKAPLGPRKTFRLVHLSIPHFPYVFDRGGFRLRFDPYVPTEEAYLEQLAYTDRVLAGILSAHTRNSSHLTIVITSDHEWRAHSAPEDVKHVPLIVLRPYHNSRKDVDVPVSVIDVIKDIIKGSSSG